MVNDLRRWMQLMEVIEGENGEWAEGMPQAKRTPSRPVYLRVGTWNPVSPASSNYAMGKREKGLSVYQLDGHNDPVIPPDGEWAATDLRSRLRSTDDSFFLVQGRRLAKPGHDGEPLLVKPVVVGLWRPSEGSQWVRYFRKGTDKDWWRE